MRLWTREGCVLLTSGFAHEEALRNLDAADRRERLAGLMGDVVVVAEALPVPKDPEWGLPEKDAPILAAAIRARATHLLTGDLAHFGHLMGSSIEGVLVLRPNEYLQQGEAL